MDDQENDDDLFRCAICGVAEGDSTNLTSQNNLQTNATVRCGHMFCNSCIERELSRRRVRNTKETPDVWDGSLIIIDSFPQPYLLHTLSILGIPLSNM